MSRLLTSSEVAERLGITKRAVIEKVGKRVIPYIRLGRLIRTRESDLESYIDSLTECDVTEAVDNQRLVR